MVNTSLAVNKQSDDELKVVINEAPLKWCSVSLSDVVNRGKRLEASVFDVEAKQARQTISKCKFPVTKLGGDNGLVTSYTCARFKRIWLKKSDLPIFQPSTIVDIKPIPDGYISHLTQTNIEKLKVHKNQILMTCSGTIGKLSYVSKTLGNAIFSHDLLRIDCKNPMDSGYIYTYLKSKIGNKILLTNSYGAVITHIEPEHLATVPIPDAPDDIKKKINDLIVESYNLRDESNDLIDEATALLIDELHLPPIEEFDVNDYKKNAPVETFSVKLSDMAGRADASYHLPIVYAIVEHMKKYAEEVTTIGDKRISADVVLPGRFKRVYVEEGYGKPFFGGKQITEIAPTTSKYLSISKHDKRMQTELLLEENMILITRSGTIGKVALTPIHWKGWVASEDVIRVIPIDNKTAGYLYVFLLSTYGQVLLTRHTYGAVISHIDNAHVCQTQVPLLKNKDIQKRINELALSANEKRYKAYCLEQEALRIMDEEVIFAKQGRT